MTSVVASGVAALAVLSVLPAQASTAGQSGYDVSYPQCSGSSMGIPPVSAGAFDILGVNGGAPYSANPCLAAEYSWASRGGAAVSFYINTADPGPSSRHWPAGQRTPLVCPAAKAYGPGSPAFDACAYDYGDNAAADSFHDATMVTSKAVAQGAQWWLDVESANSWAGDSTANIAAIQGALDYLTSATGQHYVGIYTNSSSWSSITSSTSRFSRYPFWAPGSTLATARLTCGTSADSVTGGHIRYVQYLVAVFDGDYDCG